MLSTAAKDAVRVMRRHLFKVAAVLVILLWCAAILFPARQIAYGYGPRPEITIVDGWALPALGWLGPLAGSFAWYANPMLLIAASRLARGEPPGTRLSLLALALASTVLLPAFLFDFERDGHLHSTFTGGAAVWSGRAAFATAAATALLLGAEKPREGAVPRH